MTSPDLHEIRTPNGTAYAWTVENLRRQDRGTPAHFTVAFYYRNEPRPPLDGFYPKKEALGITVERPYYFADVEPGARMHAELAASMRDDLHTAVRTIWKEDMLGSDLKLKPLPHKGFEMKEPKDLASEGPALLPSRCSRAA